MDESDLQCAKHEDPRISTFRGISIAFSDKCENASGSSRINCEFDSNEIDERVSHFERYETQEFNIFMM
jgi:hypothetical protein